MQYLLMRLQPTTSQVISPAKKRAKLDESVSYLSGPPVLGHLISDRPASNAPSADFFSSLVLLAEILAASSLPGSLDLISRLLDTLNSVLHYEPPAQGDKSYIEQLLMSAVENAAQNVIVSLQ
jgi:U3 small nucleolar RNA-associated protein 10